MIVSANAETLDGLHGYLANAGVSSQGAKLEEGTDVDLPERVNAVVLFPDDCAPEAVLPLFERLRTKRPKVFVLVVTRRPQVLGSLLRGKDGSAALVILPRPSFGWEIVDAIRAHAGTKKAAP